MDTHSQPSSLAVEPCASHGNGDDTMTQNHVNGCDVTTEREPLVELNDKGEKQSPTVITNGHAGSMPAAAAADVEKPQRSCCLQKLCLVVCCCKSQPSVVRLCGLFRFSTSLDKLLMVLGACCALAAGVCGPLNYYFFGNLLDAFILEELADFSISNVSVRLRNGSAAQDSPVGQDVYLIQLLITIFFILGCVSMVSTFTESITWSWASFKQTLRVQRTLMRSVMRQDMSWFDTCSSQLSPLFEQQMDVIQEGLNKQVPWLLRSISAFLTAHLVAWLHSWQLTLTALFFVFLFAFAYLVRKKVKLLQQELDASNDAAGALAQEALANVGTVIAYGGEQKEAQRYQQLLQNVERATGRIALWEGLQNGFLMLVSLLAMGVVIYLGRHLIERGIISTGNMIQVLLCLLASAMSLKLFFSSLQALSKARVEAHKVWNLCDLKSKIDNMDDKGDKPTPSEEVEVELKNVSFSYPARSDVPVLQGLNLRVPPGQTLALVGASGCGKSSVLRLLSRLYDPQQGQVLFDGKNVRSLNPRWLRQQTGVVGQEPDLFDISVADNIRFGCPHETTMDDVIRVAETAQAHDFISSLPEGYDTRLGERSTQLLSGGQKQRSALARALLRGPRLLLLDEATSALDTKTEAIIYRKLKETYSSLTTVLVSHRLSAVQHADCVACVKGGRVVQCGSPFELLQQPDGVYAQLLATQMKDAVTESESSDEEDEALESEIRCNGSYRGSCSNIREEHSNLYDAVLPTYDASTGDVRYDLADGCEERRPLSDSHSTLFIPQHAAEPANASMSKRQLLWRLLVLSSPEKGYIILGVVASFCLGLTFPALAYALSDVVGEKTEQQKERQLQLAKYAPFIMMGIGLLGLFCNVAQEYAFALSGARLTSRLRYKALLSMLQQDMSWHDREENSVGGLCHQLSSEAADLQNVLGSNMGAVVNCLATLGLAVGLAFSVSWRLSLIVVLFVPLLCVTGLLQSYVIRNVSKRSSAKQIARLLVPTIRSMGTVITCTGEQQILELLYRQLDELHSKARFKNLCFAITSTIANSSVFFFYALTYHCGYSFVKNDQMEYSEVFRVFALLLFSSQAAGRFVAQPPRFSAARRALPRFLSLFNSHGRVASGLTPTSCEGKLQLQDVSFRYPTRPGRRALRDLSLELQTGCTTALVGASGSGKSTVCKLLQRFYNPSSGQLLLDDRPLQELDVSWLRRQMGLVLQEPALFQGSFAYNICYGDNTRDNIPMEEVISAARQANIHTFIASLPQGYDTVVGSTAGTQLSGGQKQLVAIARALLRRPSLLLLDEASSALDAQAEQSLQEALKTIKAERTCLVITHRLSTASTADRIVVMHRGRVVEVGTHSELLALGGRYFALRRSFDLETQS